jgi:hypothetical protein
MEPAERTADSASRATEAPASGGTNLALLSGPNPNKAFTFQSNITKPDHHVAYHMKKLYGFSHTKYITEKYNRAPITAEKIKEDFLRGDFPLREHRVIKDEIYYEAVRLAEKLMLPPKEVKFNPVHFSDLVAYPWETSVNPCEPWVSNTDLRTEVANLNDRMRILNLELPKEEQKPFYPFNFNTLYNEVMLTTRPILHKIKHNINNCTNDQTYLYDIRAFGRSHLYNQLEKDSKIRMVFGISKVFILAECMYFYPLFDYWKQSRNNSALAWGYETLSGGWNKLISDCPFSVSDALCFSLDWKSFDKTAHFDVWDDVHQTIQDHFDYTQYVPTKVHPSINNPANIAKHKNLWNWINRYLKEGPVLLPDGSRYRRKQMGVPSGALQTNVLDSWVNLIVVLSILLELGVEVNDENIFIKVMGDDSLIICRQKLPYQSSESLIQEISDIAKRRYGMILNTDKSFISHGLTPRKFEFLGYSQQHGLPYRDEETLLAKLLYPERFGSIQDMMSRCIGLAYAAAGNHPIFYKLCKTCYETAEKKYHVKPSKKVLKQYAFQTGDNFTMPDTFPSKDDVLHRIFDEPATDNRDFMPGYFFLHDKMSWRKATRVPLPRQTVLHN